MSFQSFGFLALLAVSVTACLGAGRRDKALGKGLLLAASLVFYAGGGWRGLPVLAMGICATLLAARVLGDGAAAPAKRRRAAALGACWHIGVLLAFKYAAFFTGGVLSLGPAPLGLSFFTFQQLWYLKEVASGAFHLKTGGDVSLYALFFPTVVSGPILRPQAFFPQLEGREFLAPGWDGVAAGLYAIAWGMGKKVLLADAFGVLVDNGWSHVADLSAPAAWLVVVGYTLQLYFDFSGYCDIATGVARLFGVRLPVNFNSPYASASVGEFWKRWHITLTDFLRQCVYFPLGGSRHGPLRTYGNILVVFLISGFWHGAGWTFLVWGALHGLAQIAERRWGAGRERLPRGLRWALTFLFLNVAWVFFRAPTLAGAGALLTAAVSGGGAPPEIWLLEGLLTAEREAAAVLFPGLAAALPWLAVGTLYTVGLISAVLPGNTIRRMETFRPTVWRWVLLAAVLGWSVLHFSGIRTFIYSNF